MTMYAFIPARTNSKRVPGKNYKEIAGKPLLYWTVLAATMSKHIEHTFVSVEDRTSLLLLATLHRMWIRWGPRAF
jgi:CMP-N-acetylneuraminic acid synthetase